jgi:CRISPR-associated endonuclease/helicase Cas3
MSWFLPRKRSLLAPFAVGTVDQALLGVLQTRHFFVRLFGLSHKTVIFDEVHAYDTYMSALFQRLLGWLHAIGTSVVLLSATLPAKTRRELLQAYAGEEVNTPESTYPAITWATEGQTGVVPLSAPEGQTFNIGWLSREPTSIAERLREWLPEGGCAAIICNTVGRAQTVFQELQKADIVPPEDLILFHAHFPFIWRDEIEKAVLQRFGKGKRPAKAIVVATQVIEQSLDLDFDVMISDLAPIDLLIQRAGRLHRHQRETRPALLQEPKLWITEPPLLDNGIPHFDKRRDVYEPYVLLRTYLTLQRHGDRIRIPDDTASLIEAVYGEDEITEESWSSCLREAHQAMTERQEEATAKARQKLVASPHTANLLRKNNQGLAEDNPDLHAAFQALTRLGPPSISLVCLHQVNGTLNTHPDGQGHIVTLDDKPDADLTRLLVLSAVTLTSWDVVSDFQSEKPPSGWREHSLLKHYRVVIFEKGLCPRPNFGYTLKLTREYGLEVLRKAD